MAFNIDLDRGVQSRTDPQTGMEVYMYVDEPGVYRSAHGTEVGLDLAIRSGFPTEEHLKKRKIQLALRAAHDKVLAELAEADGSEKVVEAERDGFKVVNIGYERFQVFSPDEDLLTPAPIDLRSAMILLEELSPEKAEEPDKPAEKKV